MLPGVTRFCGEITSQLLPQLDVLVVALKDTLAPVLLVMLIDCGVGVVVPICQANETCAGVTLIDGVPPTVTTTGRLTPVVPGALIDIAPENGPLPAGKAAGLTETWRVFGKLPESGVTVSQFPVPLVKAEALKAVTLELLLVTETDCDTGNVAFAGKAKVNEFGFTTSGLVPPEELAFNITGIESDVPGAVMLM